MDGKNCLLRAEFAQCYNIKTLQNLLYNILSLSAGTQVGHHLEQSESPPSKKARTFLSSHASLFSYRIFFGTMYKFQEFLFQRNGIFRHCRRRRGSRDHLNFIITILSPFQALTASRSA